MEEDVGCERWGGTLFLFSCVLAITTLLVAHATKSEKEPSLPIPDIKY